MDNWMYAVYSALLIAITILFFNAVLEYKAKRRASIWYAGFALFLGDFCIYLSPISNDWLALDSLVTVLTLCLFYKNRRKVIAAAVFLLAAVFLSEPMAYHTIELVIWQVDAPTGRLLARYGAMVSLAISAIILYFCAKVLRLVFIQATKLPLRYLLGCLVVPFLSLVLLYNFYIHMSNQQLGYYNLLWTLALLVINVVIMNLFVRLSSYYDMVLEGRKRLEQLDAFNSRQAGMIRELTSVRMVKHDLNNLLLALRANLQEGQVEQAITSIDSRLNDMNTGLTSYTGDHTIDSIVSYKMEAAKKNDI